MPGYTTRGVRGIEKKELKTPAVNLEFASKTSACAVKRGSADNQVCVMD